MYEIDLNLPKQIVADVLANHEIHSVAFVGCLMAGVSQGLAFSLAMLVMSRKTKNLSELFLISGFAQGTGYVIAGLGPWACGVLFDLVHEPWVIVAFMLATIGVWGASALYAFGERPLFSD